MDWIDLQMFMRAVEGVHGGRVAVSITPAGISSNGGLSITVSHTSPLLPGSELKNPVEVEARFPSTMGKGMIETVYDLLWKLDFRVGEAYTQKTLMNG